MQRYSVIHDKLPREVLLLKSLPCIYGKCTFCDYILDNSLDLKQIAKINKVELAKITGIYGVVEILNSGSVFELPTEVLVDIRSHLDKHKIHTVYFETYYGYRKRLDEMRDFFSNQHVRYRIGIETFDDDFRATVLNKPFPTDNVIELANLFDACCLLIGILGQTREQILSDICIAREYFKNITINIFIPNQTKVKRDQHLVNWFLQDVYPQLKLVNNIEILIDNKDLGVFVQ